MVSEENRTRIVLLLRTFTNPFNSIFMAHIFYMYLQEQSCSLTFLGFFFTIFLNFIQLKYQGTNPFTTHPKTMTVSVTCLLLYCFIYHIKHRFSRHPVYTKFVHNVMVFFSSLSLASTASLLFPEPLSHVVYFLCFLLFGGEMLLWVFKKIIQKFEEEWYSKRRRIGEPIWSYLRRRTNMTVYSMEQRFTLPV